MSIHVTLAKDARPLYSYGADTTGTAVIGGGYESVYNVRSWPHAAMTEEEVLDAAQGAASIPAAYGTFNVRRITIAERKAPFFYKVKVKWSGGGTSGSGGDLIKTTYDSCDIVQRVTQALSETRFPSTAPDQNAMIEVDAEGKPRGVDVRFGYLQMTEVHSKPSSTFTASYIDTLADFIHEHYVNADTFRGHAPGEVQIDKVSIGAAESGRITITFIFNLGKNLTNEPIPGSSLSVTRKAFDHMWTQNITSVSPVAGETTSPLYAYVNQIYKSTNFASIVDA